MAELVQPLELGDQHIVDVGHPAQQKEHREHQYQPPRVLAPGAAPSALASLWASMTIGILPACSISGRILAHHINAAEAEDDHAVDPARA